MDENNWTDLFNKDQQKLINDCIDYRNGVPVSLSSLDLFVIIAGMADILHRYDSWIGDVMSEYPGFTHPDG